LRNKTSKYRGVTYTKHTKKWVARILFENKRIFLGSFTNEYDAYIAYKNKYKQLFGYELPECQNKIDTESQTALIALSVSKIKEIKTVKYCIIDLTDYDIIAQYNWTYQKSGYANACINGKNVFMHNLLMGTVGIDHINHNGLDNRRINLRLASNQQNVRNRRKIFNKQTTSIYKGVHYDKLNKKWRAFVTVDYKCIHLGRYKYEYEAALAYDKAATKYFGEFAKLNFINNGDYH